MKYPPIDSYPPNKIILVFGFHKWGGKSKG